MVNGWHTVPFGEVLKEVSQPETLIPDKTYRILGMRWYGQGLFIREDKQGHEIQANELFRVEKDDFVYNRLFAWKGSFGIVDESTAGGYVSGEFPCFHVVTEKADPKFVHLYLSQEPVWNEIARVSSGQTNISRLRLKVPTFLAMEMPLPPLTEQHCIVARIEALAERVAAAQSLRREAREQTIALLNSARIFAIGERPKKDWVPLSTYVAEIINGKSPDCEKRPASLDEWGVLKVGAVSFGFFDQNENKALPPYIPSNPEYEVMPGDFLMCRANTKELCGACAIVGQTRSKLLLSDKTFRFVFREDNQIDKNFLNHVLKSPALRTQIEQQASGTSPTMKNISKEKVMGLLIPPFSIPEQHRLVSYLDGLQAQVSALRAAQAETERELAALMPSILDRAFKGEL